MTATYLGPSQISLTRDSDGHRNYTMISKVLTDDENDGPFTIASAPDLPAIGSEWSFGNDVDVWAFCYPDLKIDLLDPRDEKGILWTVEQKFSTRPLKRCQDTNIENPLDEPIKISGTFVKYSRPALTNYDGSMILSSSWEKLTGPQVEFDHHHPTVTIERNDATLSLPTFAAMVNTVNDDTLWGLPARCIKLSAAPWERVLFGTCGFYFKHTFQFDIDFNTFDRDLLDEGTKVLKGHWQGADTPGTADDADVWVLDTGVSSSNPLDFIRFKDRYGENCRVILDGHGQPYNATGSLGPGTIHAAPYDQSNFLLLGVPTDLESGI